MSRKAAKRRMLGGDNGWVEDANPPYDEDAADAEVDEMWKNISWWQLDVSEDQPSKRKRARHVPTSTTFAPFQPTPGQRDDNYEVPPDWAQDLAITFPSPSALDGRPVEFSLDNPFINGSRERFVSLSARKALKPPEDGAINGYIKFRVWKTHGSETSTRHMAEKFKDKDMGVHHKSQPQANAPDPNSIQRLPPDFGRQMKLDSTDWKIMTFFLKAYCKGRTLLPTTNFWFVDVAPIAAGNHCVKHALLALSISYVLDYMPQEELRQRANFHYKAAVDLFNKALEDKENMDIGKDDAIVSACILLFSHDIINWEIRRSKYLEPLWRIGARTARMILDRADPGYRYWMPENVQSSSARLGAANWVAYVEICAQPVTVIGEESTEKLYSWLLEGEADEVLKIHGVTGVSPKVLHTFAQITRLTALMLEKPNSLVYPYGAADIEEHLPKYRQWSELSPGYSSAQEMFDACEMDEHGKVNDAAMVTDLTAYSWVVAAQAYLLCRFYRKPRWHPDVKAELRKLRMCIDRMPCTGPLFTSQSPFFPVFLMGLISFDHEDREATRRWFEVVLGGASCRSSVEPVWVALKDMWEWMDLVLDEDGQANFEEVTPIGCRRAWWEVMVQRLVSTHGILSLV